MIHASIPPEVAAAAGRGWHLFPVEVKGQVAAGEDWPTVATNELPQLEKWAAQFRDCNWGIATGEASGFSASTLTVEKAALHWTNWRGKVSRCPKRSQSPRAAQTEVEHCYYRMPDGADIRNNQAAE